MTGWRAAVLRLMKVPHEPSPPPGSEPRVFRAAPNYFTFRMILWMLGHVMVVIAIIADIVVAQFIVDERIRALAVILHVVAALAAIILILRLTLGYVVMRLDYELRWYMISDRAIRIREGIVTVREKTIALANIQNTVVKQGPLQRLLGIADLEVRTAGGGSEGGDKPGQKKGLAEPMHVGYFRGVDNAHELRDIILQGVRRHRDSGLGDPDDAPHDGAAALLAEVRLLKDAIASYSPARPHPPAAPR